MKYIPHFLRYIYHILAMLCIPKIWVMEYILHFGDEVYTPSPKFWYIHRRQNVVYTPQKIGIYFIEWKCYKLNRLKCGIQELECMASFFNTWKNHYGKKSMKMYIRAHARWTTKITCNFQKLTSPDRSLNYRIKYLHTRT